MIENWTYSFFLKKKKQKEGGNKLNICRHDSNYVATINMNPNCCTPKINHTRKALKEFKYVVKKMVILSASIFTWPGFWIMTNIEKT